MPLRNLHEYQEMVDQKAEENSSDLLPNAGADHAAIVMAKMFDKTADSANLIVGSFDGSVSNQENYMESLRKAVEKNIKFNIIFLEDPNEDSMAYRYLMQKRREGYPICFRRATHDIKALLSKNTKEPIHFSVFDKNKFRYEKDTAKYLAWFSFNDEKNSMRFLSIFNNAFRNSTEINN